nr:uncharacterized protein LOC109150412 [Ipomoea trifida]
MTTSRRINGFAVTPNCSILDLRRMVKMLRFCDKEVQFWYEYGNTRKPKLMKLSSDADILGLITDIPMNKELDIYVEHLYDDQWDYDVEISRELGDDTLMHDGVLSEIMGTKLMLKDLLLK